MNNEIKEILDRFEKLNVNILYPFEMEASDCKKLLDYITNLQEQLHQASLDIQELTEKDIGCPSWCDKLTNLQQVNKNQAKRNSRQRLANQKQQELILKLQQENEYLNNELNNMTDYAKDLEQENERLKQELKDRPFMDYTTDVYEELEDYKSRCEKAIEYINKNKKVVSKYEAKDTRLPLDTFMWGVDNLLNILQNGSEKDG